MAKARRYDPYNWHYYGAPKKPRRWKNIDMEKKTKAKNVEAIYEEAKKTSKENNIPMDKIRVETSYYGAYLKWSVPESDEHFDKRIKEWEKEKAAYDEYKAERKAAELAEAAEAKKRELAEAAKTRRNVVDLLAEAIQTDPSLLDAAKKKVESSKRKV